MRQYTDKKYIEATETKPHPILKKHMNAELEIISKVENSKEKTFIDLGAGHGRLTRPVAKIARNLISIEINKEMLPELNKRSSEFGNTRVIVRDFTKLSDILKTEDVKKPVLMLVQNTLGTVEGDWKKVLKEMKKVAEEYKGEIIISFFKQEALKTWGIELYSSISWMTGELDLDKTDFESGKFVSKTGYISKWRSRKEIEEIKEFFGGEIINEESSDNWIVLHIKP